MQFSGKLWGWGEGEADLIKRAWTWREEKYTSPEKAGVERTPNINLWVLLEKLHTHSVPLKYVLLLFSSKLSFDDLLI